MSGEPRILVELDGHVGQVLLNRPPHNFVDTGLVREIADALHELDGNPACRSLVLGAVGKSFCAGADFQAGPDLTTTPAIEQFYEHALRLFDLTKPLVAAVHGAAVGAGLGLALAADFRVTDEDATFCANFNRLGIHPGFGLTYTLPALVGQQRAALLFYTGRRIKAAEAMAIGLADEMAEGRVLDHARKLAGEIAESAPLAVQSTRRSLREGVARRVREVNVHERAEQATQFRTEDFKEGIAAMASRRAPAFRGR